MTKYLIYTLIWAAVAAAGGLALLLTDARTPSDGETAIFYAALIAGIAFAGIDLFRFFKTRTTLKNVHLSNDLFLQKSSDYPNEEVKNFSSFRSIVYVWASIIGADGRVAPQEMQLADTALNELGLPGQFKRDVLSWMQEDATTRHGDPALFDHAMLLIRENTETDKDKRTFLETCIDFAAIDGDFAREEQDRIRNLGKAMGLDHDLIEILIKDELEAVEKLARNPDLHEA